MNFRCCAAALALTLIAAAAGADGIVDRPKWMGTDKIPTWDKQAAMEAGPRAQLLDPKEGPDRDIVPGVLFLGPLNSSSLIVRFASDQPCGRFTYTFFGPPGIAQKRPKLVATCGDDLELVAMPRQTIPDLQITLPDRSRTRFGHVGGAWVTR